MAGRGVALGGPAVEVQSPKDGGTRPSVRSTARTLVTSRIETWQALTTSSLRWRGFRSRKRSTASHFFDRLFCGRLDNSLSLRRLRAKMRRAGRGAYPPFCTRIGMYGGPPPAPRRPAPARWLGPRRGGGGRRALGALLARDRPTRALSHPRSRVSSEIGTRLAIAHSVPTRAPAFRTVRDGVTPDRPRKRARPRPQPLAAQRCARRADWHAPCTGSRVAGRVHRAGTGGAALRLPAHHAVRTLDRVDWWGPGVTAAGIPKRGTALDRPSTDAGQARGPSDPDPPTDPSG